MSGSALPLRHRRVVLLAGLLAAPLLLAAPPATARDVLGLYDGWGAVKQAGGDPVCYAIAEPGRTTSSAKGALRRDPASLAVARYPGRQISAQVQATLGFAADPARDLTLAVDGRRWTLLPHGPNAYAASAQDDAAIVAALRRGATAQVTATSTRGTRVTDSYALKGLGAALDAAAAACGK